MQQASSTLKNVRNTPRQKSGSTRVQFPGAVCKCGPTRTLRFICSTIQATTGLQVASWTYWKLTPVRMKIDGATLEPKRWISWRTLRRCFRERNPNEWMIDWGLKPINRSIERDNATILPTSEFLTLDARTRFRHPPDSQPHSRRTKPCGRMVFIKWNLITMGLH
jgi:hypothetical protein